MDGSNNPKVSFIPKGSLVREESFLERRRPRSAIGLLSGIVFVLVVSSFVGLYYYNNKLSSIVVGKTSQINETKQKLKDAPEVAEARVFRARVDLANDLLSKHKVVSPAFVFLADNTTESILYNKFSLKNDAVGAVLELDGEAESYSSLAFQADVFRGKTDELQKFSIDNITLTKFGSVSFSITLVFKPDFLLYTKNMSKSVATKTEDDEPAQESTTAIVSQVSKDDTSSVLIPENITVTNNATTSEIDSLSGGWTAVSQEVTTSTSIVTEEKSILGKLWFKFKFW